jgi:hypothetical protein
MTVYPARPSNPHVNVFQRRTVRTIALAQIFSGLGNGHPRSAALRSRGVTCRGRFLPHLERRNDAGGTLALGWFTAGPALAGSETRFPITEDFLGEFYFRTSHSGPPLSPPRAIRGFGIGTGPRRHALLLSANTVMVAVMSMTPLHLQHASGHAGNHSEPLAVVGATISLHVAGMYALSPLLGWAAECFGGGRTVLSGLTVLLGALGVVGLGQGSVQAVTIGLVLLGLGRSAVTAAASAVLVDDVPPDRRVTAQGLGDALMSGVGALASLASGVIMNLAGYGVLNVVATAILAAGAIYVGLEVCRHRRSSHLLAITETMYRSTLSNHEFLGGENMSEQKRTSRA